MPRTRLSSKGQVIIPRDVRERHRWRTGEVLEIAEQGGDVVLRRVRAFEPTRFEAVRGCLRYDGRPLTPREMDRAV